MIFSVLSIIGDPVTLAFDLLKKAGIDANLGLGIFKHEEISTVKFCFENIKCEAIAVNFGEGNVSNVFDQNVDIDGLWYIESLSSYILKSNINYNSKLGKDKIDKFIQEITVDNTYEAQSKRHENKNYLNTINQKKNTKYYIISTVLKSNKFKVSFYDSKQSALAIGLTLPQGISLKAGYQASLTEENTLEYASDENYLAFGVQLIPFCLELRGTKSTAQPFLKLFKPKELREWTGEIFNERLNSQLKNSIEQNI